MVKKRDVFSNIAYHELSTSLGNDKNRTQNTEHSGKEKGRGRGGDNEAQKSKMEEREHTLRSDVLATRLA